MKQQIGGLRLKNPSKTGFKPVYDMINSGTLKYFTVSSLKGFMVTLDVEPEDSEYFNLSSTDDRFITPVTSFILKFAILTPDDNTELPSYTDKKGVKRGKSSESQDSYYKEAKLQQHIWIESIIGGRPPICPPVANLSMFDKVESEKLLNFLKGKSISYTKDLKDIFNYLYDYVTKNANSGIGVIVMPKIENSFTFDDFYHNNDDSNRNQAYIKIASEIARLFIAVGVIHFDLHMGNSLLYYEGNNLKCVLIDFGRASDIYNAQEDDYLDEDEKKSLKIKQKKWENTLLTYKTDDDDKKAQLIVDILSCISELDKFKNHLLYTYDDVDDYQMDWYEKFHKKANIKVLNKQAFEELYRNFKSDGRRHLRKTIEDYTKQNMLVNFSSRGSEKDFIFPFPTSIQTSRPTSIQTSRPTSIQTNDADNNVCTDNNPGCVVMGGRKSKTYKKYKKYKKHIKTRRLKKTKNIQGYK